ncbi:hypothetical protein [Longimicrobium sp.]|jgi:hypothetical protein|uniref:hypothetical protein n=1 Tax=Longimicrobium sp. TaxID=2029185 RepID=UPI002ED7B61C
MMLGILDLDTTSNLISGFGGAILGVLATVWFERSNARKTMAFDLHRELNQESMMKARMDAQATLAAYSDYHLGELIREVPDELHSVWVISGFYDRLRIALDHRLVDSRFVSPLFGSLFCFFYFGFFEDQLLPAEWDISKNMNKLADTLRSNTPRNEWKAWVEAARREATRVRDATAKRRLKVDPQRLG